MKLFKNKYFWILSIVLIIILTCIVIFFGNVKTDDVENEIEEIGSKEEKPKEKEIVKEYEEVRVLDVIEGNIYKLKLKDSIETVRLYLVNTPTKQHLTKGKLPLSTEVIEYVKNVFDFAEKVELDMGEKKQYDSEGNLLVYVLVDGKLLNEDLIEKGLGYVYKPHESEKYLNLLYKKETLAKESDLFNIWDIEKFITSDGYNVEIDYDVEDISNKYNLNNVSEKPDEPEPDEPELEEPELDEPVKSEEITDKDKPVSNMPVSDKK